MRLDVLKQNNFSKGYVIFEHDVSLWWLKWLKPGFRHCFVVLEYENHKGERLWLELNPMSNQFYALLHDSRLEKDYLLALMADINMRILEFEFRLSPLKCAPTGIFSCVEFVKRVLGIHSFFIITPYQLYIKIKKMKNCRKKVLTN